ncbi:MAG: protein-export chaperone SecB, partial [Acetobacter persici]
MSDSDQLAPPALPLAVNLQYTRDLSFEVPAGAEIFATLRSQPSIAVNIDVQASKLQDDESVYEVTLAIKTEAKEAPETEGGAAGRKVFI